MTLRQLLLFLLFVTVLAAHTRLQRAAWQAHMGRTPTETTIIPVTEDDWTFYSYPLFAHVPRRVQTLNFDEVLLANSLVWAAAATIAAEILLAFTQRTPRRRPTYRPDPPPVDPPRPAARPIAARPIAAPPSSGRQFGDFRVISKIAEGGMGVIYRARQISMDRDVALKVLPQSLCRDTAVVNRFRHEARLLAKMDHPNIVRGIASGEANGQYYFAMELVDGEALDERLDRTGAFSESHALRIVLDVAAALRHAHARGLTHRDVKPSNVIVARDGVVKLVDLGVGKLHTVDTDLTRAGEVYGTPAFMAPEQAADPNRVDPRCDIFALGATFYQLVTNHKAFPATSVYDIQNAKLTGNYVRPRELNPAVSPAVESIIVRMMAPDPEARFQSADELIDALHHIPTTPVALPPLGDAPPPKVPASLMRLFRP